MPAPSVIKEYREKATKKNLLAQSGRGLEYKPLELLLDYHDALSLLQLESHHQVLDIGCANGMFDLLLSACCGKLTAIDPVEELAALAKINLQHVDNATVVHGQGGSLPVKDTSVDRIIMLQVLQLIPSEELEQVVSEVMRVLRPGGKAVFGFIPNLRHRDAFLNEYLTSVQEATHLSKEEKKIITERNLRANWLDPFQWSELWHRKEAETQVYSVTQGHPHASHRFHLVATKLA